MSDRAAGRVVLLVEEETQQLETIQDYLEGEGYEVLAVGTADEALEDLGTRSDIRAVVTDAHVPGRVDGIEFAHMIKKRWPQMALVLMSGHSDAHSGRVPEGAVFISKPNLLEYLAPTLKRLLAERR